MLHYVALRCSSTSRQIERQTQTDIYILRHILDVPIKIYQRRRYIYSKNHFHWLNKIHSSQQIMLIFDVFKYSNSSIFAVAIISILNRNDLLYFHLENIEKVKKYSQTIKTHLYNLLYQLNVKYKLNVPYNIAENPLGYNYSCI